MILEGFRVTLDKDRSITVLSGPPGCPPYSKRVAEVVAGVFNGKAPILQKGLWVIESVGRVSEVLNNHPWLEADQDKDSS